MKTSITLVSIPGGWPDDSPPRSACFGLAPEGESGESYESLTSYLRRLSAFHRIFPGTFAVHVLGPLLHERGTSALMQGREFVSMNGICGRAAACVNALERLTMRTDLTSRTLLPLRTCVPCAKLLSRQERFCPSCYTDDESVGRPKYDRLLWTIQCVEACPLHKALLEKVPKVLKRERYTIWLPGVSRIDGSSLANQPTRMASEEQVRSAHLVAELLDDIHQCPDKFTNGNRTSEFIQHAASTLFDGNRSQLAKYLGNIKAIQNIRSRNRTMSLPMLTIVADRCGCKICDVILGNNATLRRMYESANATVFLYRYRGVRTFKTSDALLVELEKLDKYGVLTNRSEACRLLDVNENCIQRLAPNFAMLLVHRGQELRRKEKLARRERGFNEYWKYFQELLQEDVKPTRQKVAERIFQRTGVKKDFVYSKFHTRALKLAKLSSGKRNKNAPETPPKTGADQKTINSCRKRH